MYFRLTWQENDCWEKIECALNPTAHFPSVYIAGNNLAKSALKKHKAHTHYISKNYGV
jgi:hypothetical protein